MNAQTSFFPAFIRAEYDATSSGFPAFERAAEGAAASARRTFEGAFSDIQRTVSQALSVPRLNGKLDLGVPQMRDAAAAAEAQASAFRQVAQAAELAQRETMDQSEATRLYVQAARAAATEAETNAQAMRVQAQAAEVLQKQLGQLGPATDKIITGTNRYGQALDQSANGARASRFAYVQLGQQLQDAVVQAQLGTNALVILTQQGSQAAFALSGLGGTVGRVARVFSGPFGAAILGLVTVTGLLLPKLLGIGDNSEKSARKTLTLADALDQHRYATDAARKAIADYNDEQDRARDNADRNIKLNLEAARTRLQEAIATREAAKAVLEKVAANDQDRVNDPAGSFAVQTILGSRLKSQTSAIDELRQALRNLNIDDAKREAEGAADPIKKLNNYYDDLASAAEAAAAKNDKLAASLKGTLTVIEQNRAAAVKAERDRQREARGGGSDLTPVTVEEVARIVRDRFNATVTSTTGGKHVKNSLHYAARAVDFVPKAGMRSLSKDEIRAVLEEYGINLTELFGPGDKGHSDHFHVGFRRARSSSETIERRDQARAQAAEKLAEFGRDAGDRIASINDRFADTPKLVDQANASVRQLNDLIDDLDRRKPPGYEMLVKDAKAAIEEAQKAVDRPLRDYLKDSQDALQVETLRAQGREDEANALDTILGLQRQMGPLTEAQKQAVLDTVIGLRQQRRETEILQQKQQAYLDAVQQVRSTIEQTIATLPDRGLKSIGDFLKSLRQTFNQLFAKVVTEKLFGDIFRQLEDQITGADKVNRASDIIVKSFDGVAAAADNLAASLNSTATGKAAGAERPIDSIAGTIEELRAAVQGRPANDNGTGSYTDANGDIVVTGRKQLPGVGQFFDLIGQRTFGRLADLIGIKLPKQLQTIFGSALGGAFIGQTASSLVFGGKSSATGSAIGGAIGKVAGDALGKVVGGTFGKFLGPLGSIAGGLLGGALGKVFTSTPRASATIGGTGANLKVSSVSGSSAALRSQASDTADSAITTLERIADQLGVTIDASRGSVSIGVRNGKYRVDTTGSGITKTKKGALDFGEDAEAAVKAATMDLIRDGVLVGLRASTQRLISQAKDLDTALDKALKFEGVFQRLKAIEDPVGAAIDGVDKEFTNLRNIFKEAGASAEELAQLEKLYGYERADAVKQASQQMTQALKGLLDELTTGDNGRSLRDRLSAALATYNPLASDLAAGKKVDYDAFANAARTVLDIERQLSGSQEDYFKRLDEITTLTSKALADQQNIIAISSAKPPAISTTGSTAANDNPVVGAIGSLGSDLLTGLGAKLDAVNANLGRLISGALPGGGAGGGFITAPRQNF